MKNIIPLLLIICFVGVTIFSFAVMVHEPGECMFGNCPFSITHNMFVYQTFFNVFISEILIIFAIPVAVWIIFLILVSFLFLYNFQSVGSYSRKITRWLSLFENSPSSL